MERSAIRGIETSVGKESAMAAHLSLNRPPMTQTCVKKLLETSCFL